MQEFQNPIVGGTALVRSAIKSPNYQTGVAGWTINADGTAEFTALKIGGGTPTEITITFSDGSVLHGFAGSYTAKVAPSAPFTLPGTWWTFQPKNVGGVAWNPGGIGTQIGNFGAGEGDLVLYSPWDNNQANDYGSALYLGSRGSGPGSTAQLQAYAVNIVGNTAVLTVGTTTTIAAGLSVTPGGTGVQGVNSVNSTPLYNGPVAFPSSNIVVGSWQSIGTGSFATFQNGFHDKALGGNFPAPQYRVDMFGRVELRGAVTGNASSTIGSAVLQMPQGIRPSKTKMLDNPANNGAETFSRLDIEPGGNLTHRGPVAVTAGVFWVALDNMNWLAEL